MNCSVHPEREATGACIYCGHLFCPECLVDLKGKYYCKADISKVFDEVKEKPTTFQANPNINISNINTAVATATANGFIRPKSKITALILCIFFGLLGLHRFYVGKAGTGFLWLLTAGLFGIGWIMDLILIICGGFRDSLGYPLR